MIRRSAITAIAASIGSLLLRANTLAPARATETTTATTATAPAATTATKTAKTAAVTLAADEHKFLELVNQERKAKGLTPLTFDAELLITARAHAKEMAEQDYFAHESPTRGLRTPMQRYMRTCEQNGNAVEVGREYLLVGENIFYSSSKGVARGHRAFMNSEGHRKNLLDERYEAVGIGTYTNEAGEYWVTQMFLKRR